MRCWVAVKSVKDWGHFVLVEAVTRLESPCSKSSIVRLWPIRASAPEVLSIVESVLMPAMRRRVRPWPHVATIVCITLCASRVPASVCLQFTPWAAITVALKYKLIASKILRPRFMVAVVCVIGL